VRKTFDAEGSFVKEKHEPKFRGTFTPADIHKLLYRGEISPVEMVLLTIIDSLVDPDGDGCWASNAYLSERIHKSIPYVKSMIGRLKREGLLKQIGWKNINGKSFRMLETAWSRVRTTPELDKPTGIAGNTSWGIAGNTQSTSLTEKYKEGGEGGTGATPRPATPRKPHTSTGKHESGRNGYLPPNHQPQPVPVEVNGKSSHTSRLVNPPVPKKKNEWRTGDKPHHAAARKLHKALRDNGVAVDGENDDVWSIPFRQLTKAEIDYLAVLDWFCEHCSVEDRQKLKLPTITNGRQFQKRFEWIRDCMNKKSKKLERKGCNRIEDMYGVGDEFESSEEYYW